MNELNSVSEKGLIPCAAHIKSVADDPNIVLSERESEVLSTMAWGPLKRYGQITRKKLPIIKSVAHAVWSSERQSKT